MTADIETTKDLPSDIQEKFDRILGRHLERLIGSKYGIGALSLNTATISCLILLGEREDEIARFPSEPFERYSLETLAGELDQMGFRSDMEINEILQEMLRKDYIGIDHNNRLRPHKPALSMTRLLDKAFPGMPGMNLIAYFIQTMEEVRDRRKDFDSALAQFEQTLEIHGVSLISHPSPKDHTPHNPPVKPEPVSDRRFVPKATLERSRAPRLIKAGAWSQHSPTSSSQPKILSSTAERDGFEIKKTTFGEAVLQSDEAFNRFGQDELKSSSAPVKDAEENPDKTADGPGIREENAPVGESLSHDINLGQAANDDTLAFITPSAETAAAPSDAAAVSIETDIPPPTEDESYKEMVAPPSEESRSKESYYQHSELDDGAIEQKIAAFEEALALECPICRQAKVLVEQTAKGKSFYKCAHQTCNFISWGKPYHIFCPQCRNPFLIETSQSERIILKCPRATCRYWQPMPGDTTTSVQNQSRPPFEASGMFGAVSAPRKKVVRRRRVRRKNF